MELAESLFTRNALLVEDQEVNARIAVHLMNQRGVNVACATNGNRAVQLFQASEPYAYDLIFTDIMMPEGSGMAEAQAIRALDRPDAKTIPIIALTASASEDAVREYLAAGIDDVLPKPIQPAMLDRILEKWVPIAKKEVGRPIDAAENLAALPQLKTLDTRQALRYADGDVALCVDIIKEYGVSLPQRMETIRQAVVQRDFRAYAMEFHKLRSAVATVGAAELAEEAALLEQAGKAGNMIPILKGTQRFLNQMDAQYQELCAEFSLTPQDEEPTDTPKFTMTGEHLQKELEMLSTLLQKEKYVEADTLLDELRAWAHTQEETDFLREIYKDIRSLSYHTAMEAIRSYLLRQAALAHACAAQQEAGKN